MWKTEVTRITSAKKETIWSLWTAVPNWKLWDSDVEESELFGEFQTGTMGKLKSKWAPKVTFEITECTHMQSFTSTSFLPLCRMEVIHYMQETDVGLTVTHTIKMYWWLAFLFSRLIGKKALKSLPYAVESLIDLACNEEKLIK